VAERRSHFDQAGSVCAPTNSEIARLLWLAPSTVAKHLENVYSKLGVKTRTAAVARFLGSIDVEGGDAESIVSAQS